MKNLKFPEISKKSQQSIYGAWSGSGSDLTYDGGTFDTVWLDPVDSGGSGGDYDWGDTFGDGQNDYSDYGGGGSAGDANDGTTGTTSDSSSGDSDGDWGLQEFGQHYFRGEGNPVTLDQIGLEDNIREGQEYNALMGRLNDQIEDQVKEYIANNDGSGTIEYNTVNGYDFGGDSIFIGRADIITNSSITITQYGGDQVFWNADIDVDFKDTFEDPQDFFNWTEGTWDAGTPFDITGEWDESKSGIIIP